MLSTISKIYGNIIMQSRIDSGQVYIMATLKTEMCLKIMAVFVIGSF